MLLALLLQSNKKKEAVPTETKTNMKPVALESSEKPKQLSSLLQPQPPSSPARSESRRSVNKPGVKRVLKSKLTGEKATTDSVGVKDTAGDGLTTTTKPVTITRAEQPHQEPSAKRTVAKLPNASNEPSPDLPSVKSPAANGKSPHVHLPAGRSPQTQRRNGDNKSETCGTGQEQGAGVGASTYSNRTQVRIFLFFFFLWWGS